MMECRICGGKGIVPHVKRQRGDPPAPDALDFQTVELCPTCSGSGIVPYKDPEAS
jgi:DnaJ-class molecular chaperone